MKLKLNIQRFSSTNATTHYELSQYIGTDKPTYLVDYNSDMNKIDTAIYGADAQATLNKDNIGTMTDLNTTEKSSLVGAINEVNTQVGTNTNNISTNTSNISTLGTNQGVMANLTTTEKSSLVGAINEVDAVNDTQNSNIGNLTNLTTTDKASLVGAINEVVGKITATVLWSNNDVSTSFAPQSIQLSSDDYDALIWQVEANINDATRDVVGIVFKGEHFNITDEIYNSGSNLFQPKRAIGRTSDTEYYVYDCRFRVQGAGNDTTENTRLVPRRVIGIKLF